MPLLNFKISSIFTKPSKTDPKPTDPPLFKFQLTRKKMFSKTKFIYCFFETFCMSYKVLLFLFFINMFKKIKQNETLKKLKGVLTYSFNLKVTFDPKKISFILSIDVISEEYFCQKQEDLEKIRNYFSKRISLWGFHEIYTAIKKIGKGNFASVNTTINVIFLRNLY